MNLERLIAERAQLIEQYAAARDRVTFLEGALQFCDALVKAAEFEMQNPPEEVEEAVDE